MVACLCYRFCSGGKSLVRIGYGNYSVDLNPFQGLKKFIVTIESIAGICVCAFKRSIRSGELRRKPFPPQPIFGARSHRRKRNSFGLQVFSLRDYKTIHNITVRCREKRHVRSLIDTFPSIKCLPNTKVKTAVQRKNIKN